MLSFEQITKCERREKAKLACACYLVGNIKAAVTELFPETGGGGGGGVSWISQLISVAVIRTAHVDTH
jgi:hypothetical protein